MTEATFKPEYLVPGTRIGGYQVCNHLGMGSGVVAYDVVSQEGNHYALKISRFRPGVQGSPAWVMDQRLSRCILCLQQLRACSNVAQLLAYDRYPDPKDGWQYLVQEQVLGGVPITEWVWRTTPPLVQVIQLFQVLAETCGQMAHAGICHRDLKPSNILVAPDGTLKIVDFNSATCPGVEPLTSSALDQPVTLIYVPPELASAMYQERVYGPGEPFLFRPAGDLHALGCLFYEVLTAEHPFDLQEDDERLQLQKIAQMTPMFPHYLNPAIPLAVTKVVMRLLKKNPSERYQHGRHVANDLQLMLDNLGTEETWQRPFTVPREDDVPGPLALRTGRVAPAESPRAKPVAVATPRPRKAPPSVPAPEPMAAPPAGPASQPAETPRVDRHRRRAAVAAVVLLMAFVLGKGLTLLPQLSLNPIAKLTAIAGCGVLTACAGIKVRTDDLAWLATCSKEARMAVTEVPLPDVKAPDFALYAPAKLLDGPNVIVHRAGVEIRPGPIVASVELAFPCCPSRRGRLHGVAKTGSDGASLRFDKLEVIKRGNQPLPANERRQFPICALGGQRGYWPGLDLVNRDDPGPDALPESKLHPGYIYVTTDELEIRIATEKWPPGPNT